MKAKSDEKTCSFSFEQAYARLESILNELNGSQVPLETSIELYEEADELLSLCNANLQNAERRIQTLIKKRSGELMKNENGELLRKPFTPDVEKALGSEIHSH